LWNLVKSLCSLFLFSVLAFVTVFDNSDLGIGPLEDVTSGIIAPGFVGIDGVDRLCSFS